MIKVYGTRLCKDCVALEQLYHSHNIPYEFHDFADDLQNLKDFLRLRDTSPLFTEARREGYIGIPCILLEDNTLTLTPEDALP